MFYEYTGFCGKTILCIDTKVGIFLNYYLVNLSGILNCNLIVSFIKGPKCLLRFSPGKQTSGHLASLVAGCHLSSCVCSWCSPSTGLGTLWAFPRCKYTNIYLINNIK